GSYQDQYRSYQGFVAAERDGRWGRAIEVPGLGALNKGGDAQVVSLSCASPGNCAGGGGCTEGDPEWQGGREAAAARQRARDDGGARAGTDRLGVVPVS